MVAGNLSKILLPISQVNVSIFPSWHLLCCTTQFTRAVRDWGRKKLIFPYHARERDWLEFTLIYASYFTHFVHIEFRGTQVFAGCDYFAALLLGLLNNSWWRLWWERRFCVSRSYAQASSVYIPSLEQVLYWLIGKSWVLHWVVRVSVLCIGDLMCILG